MQAVPEGGEPGVGPAGRARPLLAALEAVVRDHQGRRLRSGELQQVAHDLVLVGVAAVHRLREGEEVGLRDLRASGRRVLHEEVAAGVHDLEVGAEEARPEALLEVGEGPAVELARGVELRELGEALLPVGGEAGRRVAEEDPARRLEVHLRLPETPAEVGGQALGPGRAGLGPRALHLVEAEAVGDEEALHLLGGPRGVPAHEARGDAELARDVPQGAHAPVAARDGNGLAVRARPRRSRGRRGPGAGGRSRSSSRAAARGAARASGGGPRRPPASASRGAGRAPRRRGARGEAGRDRRARSGGRGARRRVRSAPRQAPPAASRRRGQARRGHRPVPGTAASPAAMESRHPARITAGGPIAMNRFRLPLVLALGVAAAAAFAQAPPPGPGLPPGSPARRPARPPAAGRPPSSSSTCRRPVCSPASSRGSRRPPGPPARCRAAGPTSAPRASRTGTTSRRRGWAE